METTNKTVTIPESWNEVSLDNYQEILSLDNDEDRTNHIIAILLDEDVDVVRRMDWNSHQTIMEKLSWTNQYPDEKRLNMEVVVLGETFHLIDMNDLLVGEWIDLMNYCKDHINNLHKIFSILYRDKDGKTRKGIEASFKKAMIGDLYGALVFFSHLENKSMMNIQICLYNEMMEEKRKTNKWRRLMKRNRYA